MEGEPVEPLRPLTASGANNGITSLSNGRDTVSTPQAKEQLSDVVMQKHQPSVFWTTPPAGNEDLNWFVPPVPERASRDTEIDQMLDRFGGMLDQQPKRAWLLKWNYRTRAAATGAELADVEREARELADRHKEQSEHDVAYLESKIAYLRDEHQRFEAELMEARKSFADCAAKAGLNCSVVEPVTADRRRIRKQPVVDEVASLSIATIRPSLVEEALENAKPSLHEMAGEYGVSPLGHRDFLSTLLQFFMQFLAPLVSGLMLALSLGTLIGLIDIDTLQRADGAPQLALAAALGFVIVYLMGEVFHAAVAALGRSLESREVPPHLQNAWIPRLRTGLGVAIILCAIALVLGVAEITAEGLGIRQLHDEQAARQQRFRSGTPPSSNTPLYVFILIGTLVSGPYLAYKSAKGWGENESNIREAWLMNRQRTWLEERRANPDVQQAFHRAYVVEHIEKSLQNLKSQIIDAEKARDLARLVELHPSIQQRRQAARAAAVGEASRLQQMLEDIVETHEPSPKLTRDRTGASANPPHYPDRIR